MLSSDVCGRTSLSDVRFMQVTMLLDRLNQSSDELEQMKTAFERQVVLHDNEVKGLNDKLERVAHHFDSAAATMRQVDE